MTDEQEPDSQPEAGKNEAAESSEGEKKKKKGLLRSGKFWAISSPVTIILAIVVVAWGFPYLFLGFPKVPEGYANAEKVIYIDLHLQSAYGFEKGKLKERFVILTGKGGHETPTGNFRVTRKIKDYHSKQYDSPMPYSVFFEDNRGMAMHYSFAVGPQWCIRQLSGHHPAIGSHGCVRMTPLGSIRMFKFADKGTPVIIRNPGK